MKKVLLLLLITCFSGYLYAEDWKGIGFNAGFVTAGKGDGAGAELFYSYIKDSGFGVRLSLSLYGIEWRNYTYHEDHWLWGKKRFTNYYTPIIIEHNFFYGKKIYPNIGIGAHYWKSHKNRGLNILLKTGVNISLSSKILMIIDIKHFLTGGEYQNGTAYSIGIAQKIYRFGHNANQRADNQYGNI